VIVLNVILIISVAITLSLQGVVKKSYGNRLSGKGAYLFNGVSCLVAAAFFWISGGLRFVLEPSMLPYAFAYALIS